MQPWASTGLEMTQEDRTAVSMHEDLSTLHTDAKGGAGRGTTREACLRMTRSRAGHGWSCPRGRKAGQPTPGALCCHPFPTSCCQHRAGPRPVCCSSCSPAPPPGQTAHGQQAGSEWGGSQGLRQEDRRGQRNQQCWPLSRWPCPSQEDSNPWSQLPEAWGSHSSPAAFFPPVTVRKWR